MSINRKTFAIAAIALLAASAVSAQQAASAANQKREWLTMDQLRACVVLQSDSDTANKAATQSKSALDTRLTALKAQQEALVKRQEAEKERTPEQTADWNKAVRSFKENKDAYAEQVNAHNATVQTSRTLATRFNTECATKVAEDKDLEALKKELGRPVGDWKVLDKETAPAAK